MKKSLTIIFSLILAISLCAVVFAACDKADTGVGRIKGTVVDSDGAPLEDATVVVVGNEDIIAETNARGAFTLRNVTIKDGIQIQITLQGYQKQIVTVNKKDFENEVASPVVTLNVGTGKVTGYVFSAMNDERIAGATVTIDGKTVTTDENGTYTIENVAMLRSQRITVTKTDYTDAAKTITVRSYNADGNATVNVPMSPVPVTLKGYTNKEGAAIKISVPKKLTLQSSYDVNALKTSWNIDGAASAIAEGISLNAKDPWNDKNWESSDAVKINSFMYIFTEITADKAKMTVNQGIVKYADVLRDKSDKGDAYYQEHVTSYQDIVDEGKLSTAYLPYVKVLVLDKNGNTLKTFDWQKIGENGTNNVYVPYSYDLSSCVGQDVFIVVACNIGYRATVNSISFGA